MSLVELIVVMAVFVVILAVASQAFFASLRGSNKSQVTTKVKQNADYVLSVMERSLHSASSVSCTTPPAPPKVTYSGSAGQASYFSCDNNNNTVTLGGTSLVSTNDVQVTPCSITCPQVSGTKSVAIDMTFKQAGSDSDLRTEEKASLQLKTEILLRN